MNTFDKLLNAFILTAVSTNDGIDVLKMLREIGPGKMVSKMMHIV
jgi:hypothetical protein